MYQREQRYRYGRVEFGLESALDGVSTLQIRANHARVARQVEIARLEVIDRRVKAQRQADLDYFAQHRQRDQSEKNQVWQPLQAKHGYTPAFLIEKME